jgi:hypothetical protein
LGEGRAQLTTRLDSLESSSVDTVARIFACLKQIDRRIVAQTCKAGHTRFERSNCGKRRLRRAITSERGYIERNPGTTA